MIVTDGLPRTENVKRPTPWWKTQASPRFPFVNSRVLAPRSVSTYSESMIVLLAHGYRGFWCEHATNDSGHEVYIDNWSRMVTSYEYTLNAWLYLQLQGTEFHATFQTLRVQEGRGTNVWCCMQGSRLNNLIIFFTSQDIVLSGSTTHEMASFNRHRR